MRDKLFLLKPDFYDGGNQRYYCPHGAELEGVLSFYPRRRARILERVSLRMPSSPARSIFVVPMGT